MKKRIYVIVIATCYVIFAAKFCLGATLELAPSPIKQPVIQQQTQLPVAVPTENLQVPFSVSLQNPATVSFFVTTPGNLTVDVAVNGSPVTVRLISTDNLQILSTLAISPPSNRFKHVISPTDLQKGFLFTLVITTSGNANGSLVATYPKVNTSQLFAWLRPKEKRGSIITRPVGVQWRPALKSGTVKLADGVTFPATDYLSKTSFKNHALMKNVFDPNFQIRYLATPPQYTEEVYESDDRLVVTRTLIIDPKNSCDPGLGSAGLSLCFKAPTAPGQITWAKMSRQFDPEMLLRLAEVRQKIKIRLEANVADPEAIRVKPYLNMSNEQLMDQLMNRESRVKKITTQSIVPYKTYEFKKVPPMNLLNHSLPLPTVNQFNFRPFMLALKQPVETAAPSSRSPAGTTVHNEMKFLSGFTYGAAFGNYYEVEFAGESWWHDRYYASFEYQISAGFGLRWPFIVTGDALVNDKSATVGVRASGIDANIDFYKAVGMADYQVFDGNEFVFQIGAICNLYASIPGPNIEIPCNPAINKEINLGSSYAPPLGPNSGGTLFGGTTLNGRDIGLSLESQFGYAALNPGIDVIGSNGFLTLDVKGLSANTDKQSMVMAGNNGSLALNARPTPGVPTDPSILPKYGYSLSNPRYGLTVSVVPTLAVELGVGLGPFSWSTVFGPFQISQLKYDFGEFNFPQHSGTIGEYKNLVGNTTYEGYRQTAPQPFVSDSPGALPVMK